MKNSVHILKKTAVLAVLATASTALFAQTHTLHLTVTNPTDITRTDEPVTVALPALKWNVASANATIDRQPIPSQLDDMDGDRRPDELFLLVDLKPHQRRTLTIELNAASSSNAASTGEAASSSNASSTEKSLSKDNALSTREDTPAGTYVALQFTDKKDLHPNLLRVEAPGTSNLFNDIYMHGITLESDRVGYRIYFDHRQNIDLYGKRHRRIELPTTQFYTNAQQLADGYGVDVLWAGAAIGCGSLKDWRDGLVANWTDVDVRGQRIVTTGPLRTVVEVYDLGALELIDEPTPFESPDLPARHPSRFDIRQRYTLMARHRDLRVDVQLNGASDQKLLATGVQKIGLTADDSTRRGHTPDGFVRQDGLAASWGCDYPDMGKKHLWAPEPVGLAVYVPAQQVERTSDDELNYLYVLRPDNDGRLTYHLTFCADKEATDGYHTARQWFDAVEQWKHQLDNPIVISK